MHKDAMNIALQHPATVLCIAGHDPSGGAGIHADIEACSAFGAHALGVAKLLFNMPFNFRLGRTPSSKWGGGQMTIFSILFNKTTY